MRAFSSHLPQPLLPLYKSGTPTATLPPSTAVSDIPDDIRILNRQATHIQSTLQALLDAQSYGLLAGLGRAPPPVQRSTTPSSPSALSARASSTSSTGSRRGRSRDVEFSKPQQVKRISLQAARRGILTSMRELVDVKAREGEVLSMQVTSQDNILRDITAGEQKREGIERGIREIEEDDTRGRRWLTRLEKEEQDIGIEIQALENRLSELRITLRRIKAERVEGENRLEARLSSWRESLIELDKGLESRFLHGDGTRPKGHAKGVWALPKERRTLVLVKETIEEEKEVLLKKMGNADRERQACMDGAKVWEDVLATVRGVEQKLQEEVGRLRGQDPILVKDSGSPQAESSTHGMKLMLTQMKSAISKLSSSLSHAESNDWKLLVCCIGAELEALREGQEMLRGTLEESLIIEHEASPAGTDTARTPSPSPPLSVIGGLSHEPLIHLNSDLGTEEMQDRLLERSEDEDDGPGPELLISHQDDE